MNKSNSLKPNEIIASIVHSRVSVKNDIYVIYFRKNDALLSRVCFSVNKKLGHAFLRNRIKRQVREMVSAIFDLNKSVDYVIVVKNNYLNNSFSDNLNKLSELYNRITLK